MGGKKKKDVVANLVPIYEPPPPEEEQEHVEYTDTSYTSASWEDVPPLPVIEEPKKKKKKKKQDEEEEVTAVEDIQAWSEESFADDAEKVVEEQKEPEAEKKPKKGKKGKGKKEEKEVIPDFEKPKNWKKMEKKAQDAWMKERIEQWRAEVEAEKLVF